MSVCRGTRKRSSFCGYVLYKCTACGMVGCKHGSKDECSNQNFVGARCIKCGTIGKMEVFKP